MSKGEKTKEILVDWTFGASMLDGLDRDHIERCTDCKTLLEEAEMMRPLLQDYSNQISQEARQLLTDAREQRSLALPQERSYFGRIPSWMKIAACFLVGLLAVYFYTSNQTNPENPVYLANMENVSSRDAIQSYVGKSQMFLMSLFTQDIECGTHGESVVVDRELAKKLVYQKRLLDPKLNADEFRDLKPLLDQLEILLLDIAGSDGCVKDDELNLWRDVINSRSTMLKLNLLQMEGRI